MAQKPRQEAILDILEKNGFSKTSDLVKELHYSSATIYRDLDELEKLNLVKRSYGGVELSKSKKYIALEKRYEHMRVEKRNMARAAANLVEDGDVIFLDIGSSTDYMIPFLKEKRDILVITNNIQKVATLSEMNIDVICLGGKVKEAPYVLMSEETIENALKYKADKCFLSSASISPDGNIGALNNYYMMSRIIMRQSTKRYILLDRSKLNAFYQKHLCDLSEIDCIISDVDFSENTKALYPDTRFIRV